jgi:hypothetical protein
MEKKTLAAEDFEYVIVWTHNGQATQLPSPPDIIKKEGLTLRIIKKILFVSLKKTFGF